MKQILRSVIDFDGQITQENLVLNLQRLHSSRYEMQRSDDQRIVRFVLDYFQARMEVPQSATIEDYFERLKDVEAIERLKDIQTAPGYVRTNFKYLLDTQLEEQNRVKAVAILKETQEIITKGLEVEGERKAGVRDGLQHFAGKANDLIIPDYNARIRGDLRLDGQEVWNEYETAKLNKEKAYGRFTGLTNIDTVMHGIKRGELWIHAAYPGELKTTFAMNWCYNLVTRYRSNVFYCSLEMPYTQLRKQAYVLHSANMRWRSREGARPLDYRKVRDGQLDPVEEAFYQDLIQDFTTNPLYTAFEVWAPDREVNIDDIRLEAELLHKQSEIGLIVLDHGMLIEARKKKRSKDYVVELNSVIRDAKKLALHFNHGEGIPVLMLFQINRAGKDEADKADGRYKMKALTYANEAEKSADIITTTYLNEEHRKNGTTIFCNLKNRDNPLFDPFVAKVNFSARRIYNMDSFDANRGMSVEDHQSVQSALDVVSQML